MNRRAMRGSAQRDQGCDSDDDDELFFYCGIAKHYLGHL
jgi:hypothetical protein